MSKRKHEDTEAVVAQVTHEQKQADEVQDGINENINNSEAKHCGIEKEDETAEEKEEEEDEAEEAANSSIESDEASQQPPLPQKDIPPLPDEPPPDDGWDPVWDPTAQSFYFYNRITQKTQWGNPRLPQATLVPIAGLGAHDRSSDFDAIGAAEDKKKSKTGGYNPAIHGDFDPNADYAQIYNESDDEDTATVAAAVAANAGAYEASGAFNRFTGRWQAAEINPENHNDENKSKRQMGAFFDVDAAANSHEGKSLKAERQNKKFSKKEIKAFKEKRRDRKEEKRRAWLRD